MRFLFLFMSITLGCSSSTPAADAGNASDVATTDVSRDVPGDGFAGGPDVPDASSCMGAVPTVPEQVRTDRGVVQGARADGAWSWLAIPYAEPPTGSLRWRAPQPVARCWEGVRMATTWGAVCPQIPQRQGMPFDPMAPIEGNEDCLTLNVWAPENAARNAALPVMVFIHGGGNTIGSASEVTQAGYRLYDGARLAARGNVIVVTLQYRLGALGFLAHRSLASEANGVAGNHGLLDQIEALRWVQRNVRAFGGDPTRVMLFGESAGALNTCMLVSSPLAAGLFSRALIQSGSCIGTRTLMQRQADGDRFAMNAACHTASDVPACLRALSVEAALRAGAGAINVSGLETVDGLSWGPVVDERVLPEVPLERIAAGRHNHVALVVGHNTHETGLAVPAIATEMAYLAALTAAFGATLGPMLAARYPVATYGTPRAAAVQATTDARFGCQARLTARAAAQGQRDASVFRYLYAQAYESGTVAVRALGAFHGLELLYVFQNAERAMVAPNVNELATQRAMLGYWTRFAATGDPNGMGAPMWPRYESGEPMLRIEANPSNVRGWRTSECDFVDMAIGVRVAAP
jgi:para-nitrobenzyl esterase